MPLLEIYLAVYHGGQLALGTMYHCMAIVLVISVQGKQFH